MNQIDLHTHSTASDGSCTPTELINYAARKGLSAIALTDHDTMDGIAEAKAAAERLTNEGHPIELIPGIEFSTGYEGRDIHIVGLFMDAENAYLKRRLLHFVEGRKRRNILMCEKLTAAGMPVAYDELLSEFPDSIITRAHYGRLLLKKGYVKSVKEAFDRYIGDGKPCFVSRKKISPMRAVEIIRRAGGFPVLAHPVLYHMSSAKLDALTAKLKACGLMGIEALYGTYDPSDERDMRRLADKYDLAISGGSDFHGKAKPGIDLATGTGRLFIPGDVLTEIKKRHAAMLSENESYRIRKILFTDLDETLLKTDKTISDYTFDVLKRFTEKGHFIALNTGRDKNSAYMVYNDLKLDRLKNIFVIGYNGGEIIECETGKILHKEVIPLSCVDHIQEKAAEYGVYVHAHSESHIIVPGQTKELSYYQRNVKTPTLFSEKLTDIMDEGPCKCLAIEIEDRKRLERFKEALTPWADENNITLLYSCDKLLEIFPATSGKGTAVTRLTKMLEERLGTCYLCPVAAGDEQNDISMLEAADIAIAMSNGIEAVKEAASTITEYDNNGDGLARVLEDLI